MPAQALTVISALGFPRATARTYEQARRHDGRTVEGMAEAMLRTPDELLRDLAPLVQAGIVTLVDDAVRVLPPTDAVAVVLRSTAASAAEAHQRLQEIVRAMPLLSASPMRPAHQPTDDLRPIDGEVSFGGDPVGLLTGLIAESRGDLLWLRPDQFRPPELDPMGEVVRSEVIAQGRRSRAIYPVRALTEAADTLAHRSALGEEIRLVPDVPTRMLVIGGTHAILPEPLGFEAEPRSLIRQRGIVEALVLWFEAMWEHGEPLRAIDPASARPEVQRFVLQQLAAGAQDEQIARQLGLSLRTVRRRVAELMTELGAESRFQAGVEAAKRGWI